MTFADTLADLKDFIIEHKTKKPDYPINPANLAQTYTQSAEYLSYTTVFHQDPALVKFEEKISNSAKAGTRFLDVGCCSGVTGIRLAKMGYHVGFCDYEGLGLEFIRWISEKEGLDTEIYPYNVKDPKGYDVAIALDVMEHTGNHLGFIKWISGMADKIYICYPQMQFAPPCNDLVVDEWVDTEIVKMAIHKRYEVVEDYNVSGREFLIWTT